METARQSDKYIDEYKLRQRQTEGQQIDSQNSKNASFILYVKNSLRTFMNFSCIESFKLAQA
jgi:hypothetical protein